MASQDKVSVLYDLLQESNSQRTLLNTVDYCNLNVNDYLGQGDGRVAISAQRSYITQINRQQNACISNWTVLGLEPPSFTFKPRETGTPPLYFFNTAIAIPPGVATEAMLSKIPPPDANGNTPPLDQDTAMMVKSTIQASQQMSQNAKVQSSMVGAPSIPAPPALPNELLIEVNDQTCADAFEEVYDIFWAQCNLDFYVRENILYTIIQGTQFLAYEWNEDESRPQVWNPEWIFVHVDPSRTDISRCAWAVMGFLMSADEAKSRYPDVDPDLIQANSTRSPSVPGAVSSMYPAFYRNGNFKRDMCIVWTMWQRYQPFPMDAQDALDKGRVVQGVPDAIPSTSQDGPSEDSGTAQTGDPTGGAQPPAPTVLRHAKTGDVVGSIVDGAPVGDHSHPMWPKRYGILQTQIIGNGTSGVQISSKECEFSDIPLCHNVNIPIPQTPNGQGEPTRLRPIQRALNDVWTNLIAQATANAFSLQLMRHSVYESIGQKDIEMAHVEAGKVLIIDDDVADKIGGLENGFKTIDAPEVSTALVQMAAQLLTLLDKESNMQDAPNMEGSPWTGVALEQAAAPNKNAVTMKGMRVEQMLLYLANLIDGDITSPVRISAQQLNRMCPKFPVQVWEAFQERRKRLQVDISCEITNGSGVAKSKKQQDTLAQYNNGTGPLGQFLVQVLEDLGYAPDSLIQKQIAFNQLMASAQQQATPAGAAVAPDGKPQAPNQQVTAAPQGPPQTEQAGAQ